MNDGELRHVILRKYYEHREEASYVPVNEEFFGSELAKSTVLRISEQLEQEDLIEFKSTRGGDELVAGQGRITAKGIDEIERAVSIKPKIRDYYQELGVSRNATGDEIKRAYLTLARRHHPDLDHSPEGRSRFRGINAAFQILSDSEKRRAYDLFRNPGVSDGFDQQAIGFYSCFISYSNKDQAFAERLHSDLHSKGVHVWFAPEDLKIGDEFRRRIDEAIRHYDKLLLVLSESSINSAWVRREVKTALEKEKEQNRTVLFPLRLDDAVMDSTEQWADDIRRDRHIGDFTKWKNHDDYQKAFDRLLRDLQAEPEKSGA